MNVESHIGQYKIVRTLGTGGMGTVYLGEHLLLGRRAAIKTLLPALSIHKEIVDRFFNEARAISAISDQGVVQIFDFGYHVDGTAYIVMEFLEGESLQARLDRLGKLPLVEALRLTRQLASSLHAAHQARIIHRDLKPGNLFVVRDAEAQGGERTKILDFGVCKLMKDNDDASATQTGTMLGTPVYMSPEQCRGTGNVDERADIYSLGCVLFHMLTGRTPFEADNIGDFIASHLKDDAPAPSEFAPELPPSVDAVVMRCMAKNPEDRFQTMRDLQGAIEDLLATLSDPGRLAAPPVPVKETPLGEGFRSGYDVNRSTGVRTVDGRPSKPNDGWFVDSLSPVAAADIGDEHAWEPPDKGMSLGRRAAMILLVFAVLLGGIAAASSALSGEDVADLPPPPAATPASEQLGPAQLAAHEVAPLPPIASSDDDVAEPELDDNAGAAAAAPVAEPAAAAATEKTLAPVTEKPERPAPIRKWRPQPRRHLPDTDSSKDTKDSKEAPQSQDDLYDSR